MDSRKTLRTALATAISLNLLGGTALASGPVTVVTTSTSPATPSSYTGPTDGLTYQWGEGSNLQIEGFVFDGESYDYHAVADLVNIVRVDNINASGNLCSLFAETTGTTLHYKADYPRLDASGTCDMAKVLGGRVINRGALDLFRNAGDNAKNIERVDFLFSGGLVAPNSTDLLAKSGHIVTEKSGNNPVKIAAILALDSNGKPSQYGPLLEVKSSNGDVDYGLTNISSVNEFLTNSNANPGYPEKNDGSEETLGMAFVTLDDLGLNPGQTYYGFSYFPSDVGASYDLTQPATFPQDTGAADEADLYGGAAGYFTLKTSHIIRGKLFGDDNGNGTLDTGESGIPNVSMTLYADTDHDGVFTPGTDLQSGNTITTATNGDYTFTVPADGDYFVQVDETDTDIPVGYTVNAQSNPLKVSVAGSDISGNDFPLALAVQGDAPVAANDSATTPADQAVIIDVVGNDTPANGVFTLTIDTPPTHGTVTITNGKIRYSPASGFSGTDTFIYQIEDSSHRTAKATVSVQVTPLPDFDGDGIADATDIDDDNDGIPDSVEGTEDFDGDGQPNSQDLDADGDGITDLQESGLNEARQASLDTDHNGQIDNSVTFGTNGLADDIETTADSGTPDYAGDGTVDTPVDTDGDSQPDFLDLDSDNDGIADVTEASQVDANGDGKADAGQAPTNDPGDSDSDGIEDYRDLDSDNDGLTDLIEAGGEDSDSDAHVDGFTDVNGDGYDDSLAVHPLPVADTDADQVADFRDLDSDNDGIADRIEGTGSDTADRDGNGRIDNFTDANKDGLDDGLVTKPATRPDTDGDSRPDYLDVDSDNDGISDLIEAGGQDSDFNGRIDHFVDQNGDGMEDSLNTASGGTALPLPDTDHDGVRDYRDLDSDGDGMNDVREAGLSDSNGDGKVDDFSDANQDGMDDNAQAVLGAGGLKDTDGNGVADFVQTCDCGDQPAFRTGLKGSGAGSFGPGMLVLAGLGAAWRRRRRALAAGVTALIAVPAVSQADNSPSDRDFDSRVYVGAGVGVTQLQPEPGCGCYRVEDDSSEGSQAFIGVDVSRSFSVEGYYADLGGADVAKRTGEAAGSVDYQVYGISAVGYLLNSRGADDYENGYDDEGKYRREGLSIYGRAGVGAMHNDADVSYQRVEDVHLQLGVGAEYGWQNGVAARAEYTSYDKDAKMLSLALLKRFGQVETPAPKPVVVAAPQPKAVARPVAPKPLLAVDADGDGVPDSRDICLGTAKGVRVNHLGCPVDRDNDGVPNEADKCPNTPAHVAVDEHGCSKKPAGSGYSGILQGVNFHVGSDRLTERAKKILDGVASELKRFPRVTVIIVGHTDNQGSAAFNKDLSIRRAKVVARYLVTKGVLAKRLRYAGRGDTQPIASNDTPEGRAMNRRVEFVIR